MTYFSMAIQKRKGSLAPGKKAISPFLIFLKWVTSSSLVQVKHPRQIKTKESDYRHNRANHPSTTKTKEPDYRHNRANHPRTTKTKASDYTHNRCPDVVDLFGHCWYCYPYHGTRVAILQTQAGNTQRCRLLVPDPKL